MITTEGAKARGGSARSLGHGSRVPCISAVNPACAYYRSGRYLLRFVGPANGRSL